ncbi:hypothetical protein M885DRAFT_625875 [Pelagophyceae sp. CCMP2097]|nr:hypothetical protein M885DRAFT_625875 [Pelagophyceae sp. CCMP2097]
MLDVVFAGGRVASFGLAELKALPPVSVDSGKLEGYRGCAVSALLGGAECSTGVFCAGDGVCTDAVSSKDLGRGVIVYGDASGAGLEAGGPLRLWFPDGAALQKSVCGKLETAPANLKGVVQLALAE